MTNSFLVFRMAALALAGGLMAGCATGGGLTESGWWSGGIAGAPLERIQPGSVVRFRLKQSPNPPRTTVKVVDEGGQKVTYRSSFGVPHHSRQDIRQLTVGAVYGRVGFVSPDGEGVRFDEIEDIEFTWPLTAGERLGDSVRMGILVPLVLPCMLLQGCPMR